MSNALDLTITFDVTGGGFDGLPFCAARVVIGPEFARRIRQLAGEVRRLDVYKVQLFDYRAIPLEENDEGELVESEARTDADCLNVTSDGFFWSGYVKHTDERWETANLSLSELDREPGEHNLRSE
jgi:hypothetical protein